MDIKRKFKLAIYAIIAGAASVIFALAAAQRAGIHQNVTIEGLLGGAAMICAIGAAGIWLFLLSSLFTTDDSR